MTPIEKYNRNRKHYGELIILDDYYGIRIRLSEKNWLIHACGTIEDYAGCDAGPPNYQCLKCDKLQDVLVKEGFE